MQISVQYKRTPAILPPQPDIQKLLAKKRELKRTHRRLEKQNEVIEKQLSFLDSTLDFAEVQIPKDIQTHYPKPEQIQSTLDLLNTNFAALYQKEEDINVELEAVDDELNQIKRLIAQQAPKKLADTKMAELIFDSNEEQDITINLSYLCAQASWNHYYKVNVSQDLKSIDWTMMANIRQTTAEDWDQAAICLSNMPLQHNSHLPRADSWRIFPRADRVRNLPTPVAASMMMAGSDGDDLDAKKCKSEVDFNDFDDEEIVFEEAEIATATVKQMVSAEEYELPGLHKILSGQDDSLVTLQQQTISGNFYHLLVPAQDPQAYIVCEIEHKNEWMPGMINLYWDDRFLTRVPFEQADAADKLKLNLGVDKEVVCKHQRLKDKYSETVLGMVERSNTSRKLKYKTTIENRKSSPIKIELFASTPLSSTDKIQIKDQVLKPDPKEIDYHDREGVNHWYFELEPKAIQTIENSFTIKYPRKMKLNGI